MNGISVLEELQPGLRVKGLLSGQVATIISVTRVDDDAVQLVVRDESGELSERYLSAERAVSLSLASTSTPPFDADSNEFRLVAEALRIKYAALYDPLAAVNSSDIDPLPHQIRAVYEDFLPQVPLRYLLADDPGAGKTIMAGLYIKELILRSDCERAIIVAPGSLVEQWREELATKFDLGFEVFSRTMVDDARGRNAFADHPYLIVRMDQISRDDDLMQQLTEVRWDVAVVDEAHRMSAHFWSKDIKKTKRFKLGKLLSETAQNFLLMTATPHAGKEDDFQLFMSLLDEDRFEGQYREGIHRTDTTGLMIRRTKEELLTFEGKPLFPERRAYTVAYELSPGERELYERVTEYVCTQMGRAEQIIAQGETRRGQNIGFALTILQRRLASSPEAILRSLERREKRLSVRLGELQNLSEDPRSAALEQTLGRHLEAAQIATDHLPHFDLDDFDDLDDETSDDERARFEYQIDMVVDLATSAQSIGELRLEIAVLGDLITAAKKVRAADVDEKWVQLRSILEKNVLPTDPSGSPRKLIIFTEHRDTLDYLQRKIAGVLGRNDAIVTIHGGTRREDRMLAREQFTKNPDTVVLLATDAAGEGLNLQRAHLMVNYDLPWNPNRIEQRFGRIHRIGQREVCQLWNLVAPETREGDVFKKLLDKITAQGKAYNGNLFNVLGERGAFQGESLRDLVLRAIRYGDKPEIRAQLDQIIDASYADGIQELLEEKSAHPEMFPGINLEEVRRLMEKARERKLAPGYIRGFFIPAFKRLGGRISERESGRWQISRIPIRIQEQARTINRWLPIPDQYERVTFSTQSVRIKDHPDAVLLAPGHPLLQAVIELTIKDLASALSRGAIFIDRRETQTSAPSLLYAVEQKITNPDGQTLDHHFDYVEFSPDCEPAVTGAPPYLDFDAPDENELEAIRAIISQDWVQADNEENVSRWAYRQGMQPRRAELLARLDKQVERVRTQVRDRLTSQINYWDRQYNQLINDEQSGRIQKMKSKEALERVHHLEQRMADRFAQLDQATDLVERPAIIRGAALIIPAHILTISGSAAPQPELGTIRETDASERRGIDAAMAAERALGRHPEEMEHFNPGFDIRSTDDQGRVFIIEVKGYLKGATEFEITNREVATAQNQGDHHRLILVAVDPNDPAQDELRYVRGTLNHLAADLSTRRFMESWSYHWKKGGDPS
ncbi:MAG: SNF2-related protein [Propionibacteriaceae bacterium]|nr:SNF2-related protein [Propionibacteriaceae bacterium]